MRRVWQLEICASIAGALLQLLRQRISFLKMKMRRLGIFVVCLASCSTPNTKPHQPEPSAARPSPTPTASIRSLPSPTPSRTTLPSPAPSRSTVPAPSPAPALSKKTPPPAASPAKGEPKKEREATPVQGPKLPEALAEIERTYQLKKTITASFKQISKSASTGIEKNSTGFIKIKQPNMIRWEIVEPDKSLLVSDGKKFWFYTPPFEAGENGQVIVKKTATTQSRLAHLLIAGSFSSSLVSKEVELKASDSNQFQLIPKKGAAGTVKSALIEIDPVRKRIVRVVLDHQDGNRAEISLNQIELGKNLPDSDFRFIPPPGTVTLDPN